MSREDVIIGVCGTELPGMTRQMLEDLIEGVDDHILNETPEECATCEAVTRCKQGAVVLKGAAVKLIGAIDEFETTVKKLKAGGN